MAGILAAILGMLACALGAAAMFGGGALFQHLNRKLWYRLEYARYYTFPQRVFTHEVYLPQEARSGLVPMGGIGALIALLALVAVVLAKYVGGADMDSPFLYVPVSVMVFGISILFIGGLCIAVNAELDSKRRKRQGLAPAEDEERESRLRALSEAVQAAQEADHPTLNLHRRLWKCQWVAEPTIKKAVTQTEYYPLDSGLVAAITEEVEGITQHPSCDSRLGHRCRAFLESLSAAAEQIGARNRKLSARAAR